MNDQANILVVDDEPGMLNSMVGILEDEGYFVYGCSNGSDAIKLLSAPRSEAPIDLVISDLNLPDITGLAILFHLKKAHPDAAFILMTANATLETALEAVNQGAFAYQVKPLDMDALIHNVHNALMQQQLKSENRELLGKVQQSEVKYRTLVERAGDGIFMVDAKTGCFTEVNPAMTVLTGREKGDLLDASLLCLQSDEEPAIMGDLIDRTLQLGQLTANNLIFRKPGGEQVFVDLKCSLMEYQEGRYILGVARDTTERKAGEDALREKSRLASIGQLSAGVAHEINNPLAVIAGFSELLLLQEMPDLVHERLEAINSQAKRAGRIVQNLLSFARTQEPRKQCMSIAPILEQALALKASYLAANDVIVYCKLDDDLPRILVDDQQMLEVILNIIGNAEQALAPLSGHKELSIRVKCLGERLSISVSDNGPGIAPDDLAKIFDPFFTTKAIGQGTGLGLSICYGIVQQHSGDIWADSSLGNGTTFNIELPVSRLEIQTPTAESITCDIPDFLKKVLIVDDEAGIRSFVAQVLGEHFDVVDQAEDGQAAWQKVQVSSYDCILLDMKMPGMCGQEFYKLLKEFDSTLAGRVIFVTGDTLSEETRTFLTSVGNEFLSKPFSFSDLLQKIGTLREGVAVPA